MSYRLLHLNAMFPLLPDSELLVLFLQLNTEAKVEFNLFFDVDLDCDVVVGRERMSLCSTVAADLRRHTESFRQTAESPVSITLKLYSGGVTIPHDVGRQSVSFESRDVDLAMFESSFISYDILRAEHNKHEACVPSSVPDFLLRELCSQINALGEDVSQIYPFLM